LEELNTVICDDCIEAMKKIPDNSIDSCVTDPPYGLSQEPNIRDVLTNWLSGEKYEHGSAGFMGRSWDSFVPGPKYWEELFRILKPGAHILVFSGTRTYDLSVIALRLAGFEIRDQLQWIYGCLSEDTEILTVNGWRNHKNIKKNDIVFSMNLDKNKLGTSGVNHVYKYRHDGKMISIKNHNTDQLLTLNHKVICKQGKRHQRNKKREWYTDARYNYRDASMIDSTWYTFPVASCYDGDYSIGCDFAEVIGWVLSEGNYQKDCNAVNIYQSSVNAKNVSRIKYVLGRSGIGYNEYKRNRTYKGRKYVEHQFYISGEDANKIKKIIPNKKPTRMLWHLRLKEKDRLITGLCRGDGSSNDKGRFIAFYQNNMKFLEWFQVLIHLSGKQGWINDEKWSCSIHYNDSTQIQGKHHKDRIVDYSGIVWCINTDSGNFIARRNGKIFITGNSGFPKSMNISKAIDKKFGKEREVISETVTKSGGMANVNKVNKEQGFRPNNYNEHGNIFQETAPASEEAKIWDGWGTQLKPAHEPICLARKPLEGKNIVENILALGTGGINIDECRIPVNPNVDDMLRKTERGKRETATWDEGSGFKNENNEVTGVRPEGRWPTNILLQHHQDCKHIGFKEVKGHKGYPNGPGGVHCHEYQKEHQDVISYTQASSIKDNEPWKGHANADGNEIVEDWNCHPDCPIKILNDQSGFLRSGINCTRTKEGMFLEHGGLGGAGDVQITHGDSGGASRFFYCAKASKSEKNKGCGDLPEKMIGHNRFDKCGKCGGYILQNQTRPSACKCEEPERVHNTVKGNTHPTVKPLKLCRYLVSLITPKGGTVIDPFAGSGSILIAAKQDGFNFIGIDKEEEYCEIARCRLDAGLDEDADGGYSMVVIRSRKNEKSMEQKTFFDLE